MLDAARMAPLKLPKKSVQRFAIAVRFYQNKMVLHIVRILNSFRQRGNLQQYCNNTLHCLINRIKGGQKTLICTYKHSVKCLCHNHSNHLSGTDKKNKPQQRYYINKISASQINNPNAETFDFVCVTVTFSIQVILYLFLPLILSPSPSSSVSKAIG